MVTYEELMAELHEIAGKKAKVYDGFKSVTEMVKEWGISDGAVRKILLKANACGCLEVDRKLERRLDGAMKSVPIYKIVEKKRSRK